METSRLTVLELNLTEVFNWQFDVETNSWKDFLLNPVAVPLFEFVLPLYGELRFVSLSKARGFGIMIIEDVTIVYEFKSSAKSYTQSTGIENGLIVKYYTEYQPYKIQNINYNENTSDLFLVDTSGHVS